MYFLPGMKLGSDFKTGRNWSLTSWLRYGIPDLGAFTMSWEPNGENSQRLMIRQRGQPYWTTGDLNNDSAFEFMNVKNQGSIYQYHGFYPGDSYGDQPYRLLTDQGQAQGDNGLIWSPLYCYGYDSGNGCVAGSNSPSCRSKDDKIALFDGYFALGMAEDSYDDNSSVSFSDCMVRCWNNCTCLAYNTHDNRTGL
ncbi:putative non-specific serine/threonine protein kinase [Helianthus annuus]|uniref:Non-specific serine/threonine protein kinase n=1 Tax=Helianthus annuus TaxID=4232 RepID=A0A251SS58_HELAN|nr:putative non-specific serine/threonine protein kinase [Helianthus annuus]KAJ0477765.1 putative non-specific serine/threonine protein kinase [Helianthus annuus]KAJ0498597.1 putative non-specific serine/threonine protein kinase [Helianthus annuus]KAJ0664611.1 putative non-specific serine/threonine protein kinase [Helianthus annuus]KAJ0672062.1 putative non-specific serine/threonine protein kinase [Helianthus annuus]